MFLMVFSKFSKAVDFQNTLEQLFYWTGMNEVTLANIKFAAP